VLVPLDIPPGVFANGTEYQSRGRWSDASLVRWRDGYMGPIGGWSQWGSATFSGSYARAAIAWVDQSDGRWLAVGTHDALYVYDESATQKDITPGGFSVGVQDSTTNTAYGAGTYGSSNYGSPRPDVGVVTRASTWSLDTWGEYCVGCMNSDGKLYEWQLDFATPTAAAVIANAPTDCEGLVVTTERILMALGADGDPRLIKWCDQEDNTDWTSDATNQAGDKTLDTPGRILAGRRVRGRTLILTSYDAHTATYSGQPFVFDFEKVGDGCGLAAPAAVTTFDGNAVWMGEHGFFVYDGYVRPLESDVIDYVVENLSSGQKEKIHAFTNHEFSEVWWLYPSDASNECDSYVSWNYVENHWSIGTIARSAAVAQGVFSTPLLVGTDGKVYEHESGTLDASNGPFAESGPFEIGVGERLASVKRVIPDEDTLGDAQVVFSHRMYPTATITTEAALTPSEPTDVRFQARQVMLRVEGVSSADWRWGVPRLEITQGGKR